MDLNRRVRLKDPLIANQEFGLRMRTMEFSRGLNGFRGGGKEWQVIHPKTEKDKGVGAGRGDPSEGGLPARVNRPHGTCGWVRAGRMTAVWMRSRKGHQKML